MSYTRTMTTEETWHEWFCDALNGMDDIAQVTWDLVFDEKSFWFDLEEAT